MNMSYCAAVSVVGLGVLAWQAPSHAQEPSAERAARAQQQSAQAPRAQRQAAGTTHRRSTAKPRSRTQQGSASNASSEAASSSEGGVGVGSQGQSLVMDNHSRGSASSAIAPPLASSNDTCMGSASVGASGMAFGLSLGKTYIDENCMMLKNSRELWNMGYRGAAIARMCMDDRNRQALETSGVHCPEVKKTAEAKSPWPLAVVADDPSLP